eukprot:scaffold84071_cov31-Tisochrysis_lutea.AAC.2
MAFSCALGIRHRRKYTRRIRWHVVERPSKTSHGSLVISRPTQQYSAARRAFAPAAGRAQPAARLFVPAAA